MNALTDLRGLIDCFEHDRSFWELDRFRERAEALDRLDTYDLDSQLSCPDLAENEVVLYRRAISLRSDLESANWQLFDRIREAIRRGNGGDAVLEWTLDAELARGRDANRHGDGDSYDYLDELVSGVLRFPTPGEPKIELTPEMVAYQPTPARHILDLIRQARLTAQDVFIDLGSGLGHVTLLVAASTQARAVGIELEPSYVKCARHCADELNLDNATFMAQDVREADLSRGTVFYLFTPFRGTTMRTVLDRLRAEAEARAIQICTFGPCTPIVEAESWLQRVPVGSSQLSFFCSRK